MTGYQWLLKREIAEVEMLARQVTAEGGWLKRVCVDSWGGSMGAEEEKLSTPFGEALVLCEKSKGVILLSFDTQKYLEKPRAELGATGWKG